MRPPLTKTITINDFTNYYWLKEELQQFCRAHGLSAAGSKVDIAERITIFLQTGEIIKPKRSVKKKAVETELTLETVITEGHTCSQSVRHFFKQHIPNFHFSTYIQNFFKENVGKTYADVLDAWHAEQQRLKDPSYVKDIAPQFEYNRFIRDFFADPANSGKTRDEAIAAWNIVKSQAGDNVYNPRCE